MADVFSRADWALRSEEFGALVEHETVFSDTCVAMQLIAPGIDDPSLVERLWTLWRGLPAHPNILLPVAPSRTCCLVLRYAALNWKLAPLDIDSDPRAAVVAATWGVELTRVYDFILACAPRDELGWFTCPFVKIDLQGVPRVGFVSPAGSVALMHRTAPEVLEEWPFCRVQAFVFAIGQLLLGLIATTRKTSSSPLGNIIKRCLAPDPMRRFQSLAELRNALVEIGGRRNSRVSDEREDVWPYIEDGIGYIALSKPGAALKSFDLALKRDPNSKAAIEGYNAMLELILKLDAFRANLLQRLEGVTQPVQISLERPARRRPAPDDQLPAHPTRYREWLEIRPVGRKLEEAGRYRDALEYYRATKLGDHVAAVHTATARCHLRAYDYGPAIDCANRAIDHDASHAEAHAIATEAWWQRKQHPEALDACDAWLAALPDDPNAHYLRAKILLGLGRIAEARDECDRTTELAPKHLSAMLLRWQLGRTMKRIRGRTGHAEPAPLDLPEHLRHLRELLVTGRNAEAISILEKSEHAQDGAAQLLRADLLAFSGQPDAALAAFDQAAQLGRDYALAAGVGKAAALTSLDQPAEALVLCDALVRDHPNASEAHEARALALQALGRLDEADAAMKRALSADAQRSQMHVRLAGP